MEFVHCTFNFCTLSFHFGSLQQIVNFWPPFGKKRYYLALGLGPYNGPKFTRKKSLFGISCLLISAIMLLAPLAFSSPLILRGYQPLINLVRNAMPSSTFGPSCLDSALSIIVWWGFSSCPPEKCGVFFFSLSACIFIHLNVAGYSDLRWLDYGILRVWKAVIAYPFYFGIDFFSV